MEFYIACSCGRQIPVSASQAGTAVECACGLTCEVPGLGELRRQAGMSSYRAHPADVVRAMLARGELPPGDTCAKCGMPASEVLDVTAECERMWTKAEQSKLDRYLTALLVPMSPRSQALPGNALRGGSASFRRGFLFGNRQSRLGEAEPPCSV